MNKFVIFVFVLLCFLPVSVYSECTCETEAEDRDRIQALKFKLVAIASIFLAGAIGVSLPVLGKTVPAFRPENDIFFVIKAFAAGVILATGFVHVLPDAFERLTSPCLSEKPWGDLPFSGFIAMVSAILTMMVDLYATGYYEGKRLVKAQPVEGDDDVEGRVPVHKHTSHGHAHASAPSASSDLIRSRVVSQVLELGIVVHSVIIGVSLGTSESPKTIKPLVAALTFHQLFEGIGLGGCISKAKFTARTVAMMVICFSLTTPIGISIGFGVSNIYNETSPTALIVEGVFNSISAGILIYMALVDFLAADFMNPRIQGNVRLQLRANLSLLVGAGCMSLLAKWA